MYGVGALLLLHPPPNFLCPLLLNRDEPLAPVLGGEEVGVEWGRVVAEVVDEESGPLGGEERLADAIRNRVAVRLRVEVVSVLTVTGRFVRLLHGLVESQLYVEIRQLGFPSKKRRCIVPGGRTGAQRATDEPKVRSLMSVSAPALK